jgi:pimeloyl-ACP methyl ester carboxylesterase
MIKQNIKIDHIPALLWGDDSDQGFIFVHGKKSSKEEAQELAEIAVEKSFQVLSFDLPQHGDRLQEDYPCSVQNGVNDLNVVIKSCENRWKRKSLFACSLGAYFSLVAYRDICFEKCLFLSPILDMEQLIKNMMSWFHVDEEKLAKEKEIPTPMGETLSWDYYSYVKANPITKWDSPTYILYGTRDHITERTVLENFSRKFSCSVEWIQNGEHYFQSEQQKNALHLWLINHI